MSYVPTWTTRCNKNTYVHFFWPRPESRLSYHNKSWIGGQQHFVSLFRVITSNSILKSRLGDDTPANRTTNYTRQQLHMWTVSTVHQQHSTYVLNFYQMNQAWVEGTSQQSVWNVLLIFLENTDWSHIIVTFIDDDGVYGPMGRT